MAQRLQFYDANDLYEIPMASFPTGAPNCICWPVEKSSAQTYRRKFVSIGHGGPCPQRCAGGERRNVINNVGDSRILMITVTVQSTSTRLVVWKSVNDTHVYLGMWHDTEHRMLAVR